MGIIFTTKDGQRLPVTGTTSSGDVTELQATVARQHSELNARADKLMMDDWQKCGLALFIHWGVFSVLAGEYEGTNIAGDEVHFPTEYDPDRVYSSSGGVRNAEWIQIRARIPSASYKAFSTGFSSENWDPEMIAKLAYEAGMRYIILTAKHHDGFCLFESENSEWDVSSTNARVTIIDELKAACDKYGLGFGLYYSQCTDWAATGGFGQKFLNNNIDPYTEAQHTAYVEKQIAIIRELVEKYELRILWYDEGNAHWTAADKYFTMMLEAQEKYWPDVIVNDRLENDQRAYGDFATGERGTAVTDKKYIESCFVLNNTWGYSKFNETNYDSVEAMFKDFIIASVSNGQNSLLNIGPKADGSIPEKQIELLKSIGKFCQTYGSFYGVHCIRKLSHPTWGRMVGIDEKTIRCFVLDAGEVTLDGFDTSFVDHVKVYGNDSAVCTVTATGITIDSVPVDDDAKVGVVDVYMRHPYGCFDANYAKAGTEINAITFIAKCMKFDISLKDKRCTIPYKSYSSTGTADLSTDIIWNDATGDYHVTLACWKWSHMPDLPSRIRVTDVSVSGEPVVIDYTAVESSGTVSIETVHLINGHRYRIDYARTIQSTSYYYFKWVKFV